MSRLSRLLVPAAFGLALGLPGHAGAQSTNDAALSAQYSACAFYPLAPSCDAVYRAAVKDQSPAAGAVREAFEDYGRYMKTPSTGLSDDDRTWLKDNGINFPSDLTAADLAGLHNAITDAKLQKDPDARKNAIMGFISRAVEAELYCYFNSCPAPQSPPSGS